MQFWSCRSWWMSVIFTQSSWFEVYYSELIPPFPITSSFAHAAAAANRSPAFRLWTTPQNLKSSHSLSCNHLTAAAFTVHDAVSSLCVCDADLIAGSWVWPFPVFIFSSLAVHGGERQFLLLVIRTRTDISVWLHTRWRKANINPF